LKYESDDGLFADFHSNRHMFITSLERAGLSPKMAQTLARHSDVRLTLGVYTHVGLHDQTTAIGSLPAPPSMDKCVSAGDVALRATGTDGPDGQLPQTKTSPRKVPTVVPRGAENGAIRLASETNDLAPNCTGKVVEREGIDHSRIATNPKKNRRSRTERERSASRCIDQRDGSKQVSPRGLEPLTFGSGGRRSIQLSYGDGDWFGTREKEVRGKE
jgi:hypothetical protein